MNKGYTFKVVVFTEQVLDKKYFIAQCLNPDICVQAKTADSAVHRLLHSIADNMALAVKHSIEPFSSFGKAPKYYTNLFEKAEVVI